MNIRLLRKLTAFMALVATFFCAFSLSAQELAELNVNKAYKINRFNLDKCMYANDPNIGIGAWNATETYYWQFVPAENGEYYIRNVATGTYIQSSKINVSQAVTLGTTRVAYKVFLDKSGKSTDGTYYIVSADQENIDNTTQSSLGLNCGANVVAYYHISGQNGNSFWNLTELDVDVDPNVTDGNGGEGGGESGGETTPDHEFSADKFYFITAKNDASAYIAESGDMLTTRAKSNSEKIFWSLIPVEGEKGTYYMQNAVTKNYAQSSNVGSSVQIAMGAEPMKYIIGKDETAGASTTGLYHFYSADQNAASYADAMGLNFDGNNTRNVVSWSTASGRANSYWNITETELTYDPQYIAAVPTIEDLKNCVYCRLVAADGRGLTKDGENLTLVSKLNNATQSWAFVGTGNSTGYYVVNGSDRSKALTYADGKYSFTDIKDAALWSVEPLADGGLKFFLLPASDTPTYVTTDSETVFYVAVYRSPMSLKSQVYYLPCGTKHQTYISKFDIDGSDVMNEIHYSTTAHPGTYYTLHTLEKATVARGGKMNIKATLGSFIEGNKCYIYFDWNRDGQFDTAEEFDGSVAYSSEVTVPEDAVLGKTRMRIRITNNGNADCDGKVNGAVYDFIINIAEATDERTIALKVNDTVRGKASATIGENTLGAPAKTTVTAGETISIKATPADALGFVCWKNGRTLYSTEAEIDITVSQNLELTACFSPYDDFENMPSSIKGIKVDSKNLAYSITRNADKITVDTDADVKAVIVYSINGQMVAKSSTKTVSVDSVNEGVYIVKVVTAAGDGAKKISLR